MGERRLIEITSTIKGVDSPLGAIGYVTSLNESDIYLLLKYLGSSKYRGMTFLNALFAFSNDYLISKNLLFEESSLDILEEKISK